MELSIESGASESIFNLTDLKVTHLKLGTGASSNKIYLPAQSGIHPSQGGCWCSFPLTSSSHKGLLPALKLDSAISGNKVGQHPLPLERESLRIA